MIPIPSVLTQKYYTQQKEKGKTDMDLAIEFFVSISTFQNWKKRLGISGKQYEGRKRLPIADKVRTLHKKGLNSTQIAKVLNVSDSTVHNYLYKY